MFILSSPSLHSVLRQELRAQRVRLWPRSRSAGSRSVMAALHHSDNHAFTPSSVQREQSTSSFLVFSPLNAFMLKQIKNFNKPLVHIWLYFIIKAIKTEPCPYVYIWSGVTVMSEGGQRGTGDDYVLSFFKFYYPIWWDERGDNRDLLEELVRTEMALNSCSGWTELCPKKNNSPTFTSRQWKKALLEHKWLVTGTDMKSTTKSWSLSLKVAAVRRLCRAGVTSVVG